MKTIVSLIVLTAFPLSSFSQDREREEKNAAVTESGKTSSQQTVVDPKTKTPKLIDLKKFTFSDAADPKKLLPNRLYLRYEPRKGGFFFDVTAPNGKFDTDCRYLLPGSVIPGHFAGADKDRWFVFNGPGHDPKPEVWDNVPNGGTAVPYTLRAFFPNEVDEEDLPVYHSGSAGR